MHRTSFMLLVAITVGVVLLFITVGSNKVNDQSVSVAVSRINEIRESAQTYLVEDVEQKVVSRTYFYDQLRSQIEVANDYCTGKATEECQKYENAKRQLLDTVSVHSASTNRAITEYFEGMLKEGQ